MKILKTTTSLLLYFTMLNSNKRSITLNPKKPEGSKIFTKLIQECDVMVENFAPGALDRMGFSWEKIQEINPRMIYASVKGFGPGKYEDCKVYENVAQCAGGSASTTGMLGMEETCRLFILTKKWEMCLTHIRNKLTF